MAKQPLSGDDRARNHESGSVKHKKAQIPSLDSSHDAESSGGDGSSSSSFPRRTSVASEKSFVHLILLVVAIAIAIKRRHVAMRAAHQRISVL